MRSLNQLIETHSQVANSSILVAVAEAEQAITEAQEVLPSFNDGTRHVVPFNHKGGCYEIYNLNGSMLWFFTERAENC